MIYFLGLISSLSHSRRWLELGSRVCERKLEHYLSGPPVSWRGEGTPLTPGASITDASPSGNAEATGKEWALTSNSKRRKYEVLSWWICSLGPSAQRRNSQECLARSSHLFRCHEALRQQARDRKKQQILLSTVNNGMHAQLRPQAQYNFILPSRAISAMEGIFFFEA